MNADLLLEEYVEAHLDFKKLDEEEDFWGDAHTRAYDRASQLKQKILLAMGNADATSNFIEKLESIHKLASPAPWEQHYGYNNGGMATGFLKIPQHNGGAEVEMLAEDTSAIVELRNNLPEIIRLLKELSK